MNKVFIVGNLTRDPEQRTVRDGIAVCSFTVAVSRKQRGAEAGQPDADYFRVTTWRGLAENCGRYLAKGRKVAVTGSVSVSTYTANDGSTRASLDVTADDVEFLSPKGEGAAPAAVPQEKRDPQSGFVQVDDDELPF